MRGKSHGRVTLLGTGPSQGVPALGGPNGLGDWGNCDPQESRNRRTRTSALIEGPCGVRILIDAGPDCRAQLLAAGVGALDAVIFTHAHADHVMGLDELRQINRATGRVLPAYGFPETLSELGSRFAYAFAPATPGFYRPALDGIEVLADSSLKIGSVSLTFLEQDHTVVRTLGIRSGDFAYSTDVVRMPSSTLAKLDGLDTWVVGCFRVGPHPVHAGLSAVAKWRERLRPGRTILTHMSSSMDWATLKASLPKGVEPGHDLMAFEFDPAR